MLSVASARTLWPVDRVSHGCELTTDQSVRLARNLFGKCLVVEASYFFWPIDRVSRATDNEPSITQLTGGSFKPCLPESSPSMWNKKARGVIGTEVSPGLLWSKEFYGFHHRCGVLKGANWSEGTIASPRFSNNFSSPWGVRGFVEAAASDRRTILPLICHKLNKTHSNVGPCPNVGART